MLPARNKLYRVTVQSCARPRPFLKLKRSVVSCASAEPSAIEGEQYEVVKSDKYSEEMQDKMGTSLTYRHEDGMNYHRILDDLLVGSCPKGPDDVDRLKDEGVGTIVCLQQDTDMAYFELDIEPVVQRSAEVGVAHLRTPINDFDPFHLRQRLPDVVRALVAGHEQHGGSVYVHCTAGMGRAPAVALAFMWWSKGIPLDEAYSQLIASRMCHPKLYAIRQAAADLLYGGPPQAVTIRKRGSSFSESVEIAGLDVGWGNRLAMEKAGSDTWQLTRILPPGTFPFKFIMDGVWSYDADLYLLFDGENTNNAVNVCPTTLSDADLYARERILKDGGLLTADEQQRILATIGGE